MVIEEPTKWFVFCLQSSSLLETILRGLSCGFRLLQVGSEFVAQLQSDVWVSDGDLRTLSLGLIHGCWSWLTRRRSLLVAENWDQLGGGEGRSAFKESNFSCNCLKGSWEMYIFSFFQGFLWICSSTLIWRDEHISDNFKLNFYTFSKLNILFSCIYL